LSLVAGLVAVACHSDPTSTETTSIMSPAHCPAPTTQHSVLVDASHDGGVWWFPQTAPFDPKQPHQGQALADTLRARGYQVDEVGRGERIDHEKLLDYRIVIRAGAFGAYLARELDGYENFVDCPRTLILLSEYLRDSTHDDLAESLDIALTGWVDGTVTEFADHPITADAEPFIYMAGSVLDVARSRHVRVLGRLADSLPVMGIQERREAKVFFIGDTNGLEFVPQPLVNNLIAWGF
jgi:hypothetical protein